MQTNYHFSYDKEQLRNGITFQYLQSLDISGKLSAKLYQFRSILITCHRDMLEITVYI